MSVPRMSDQPAAQPSAAAAEASSRRRLGPIARLALWVSSAGSAGLALSIVLHILLGAAAATIVVSSGGGGRGDGVIPTGAQGLAVETTLVDLPVDAFDAGAETDFSDLPAIETPDVDLTQLAGGAGVQIDLPSAAPGSLSNLAGSGLGGGSGDGFGDGMGDLGAGGGGGGGGGAKFFGVEARGSRFVYVVDLSGSMDGQRLTS
ncbi:MAG: hypothetical protein ACTS27_10825, partial [Phycisphaerales bacterium]